MACMLLTSCSNDDVDPSFVSISTITRHQEGWPEGIYDIVIEYVYEGLLLEEIQHNITLIEPGTNETLSVHNQSTTFEYDEDGRVILEEYFVGGKVGESSFEYTDGLLSRSVSGSVTKTYTYEEGKCVSVRTEEEGEAATTSYFTWEGDNIKEELFESGSVDLIFRYVHHNQGLNPYYTLYSRIYPGKPESRNNIFKTVIEFPNESTLIIFEATHQYDGNSLPTHHESTEFLGGSTYIHTWDDYTYQQVQ